MKRLVDVGWPRHGATAQTGPHRYLGSALGAVNTQPQIFDPNRDFLAAETRDVIDHALAQVAGGVGREDRHARRGR